MRDTATNLANAVNAAPKETESLVKPKTFGNVLAELGNKFMEALKNGVDTVRNWIGQLAILDNSASQISAQVEVVGANGSKTVNSFESQNLQNYQNDAAKLGELAQGKILRLDKMIRNP